MPNTPTFFARLEQITQDPRNTLHAIPIVSKSLSGAVTVTEYLAFLEQAYHHVKHTVPLLMACGSRLTDQHEWLREALATYIAEEIGHQEWILNDIAKMGGDRRSVAAGQAALCTELMVAYAYDTIARKNPVGFLGMVYVLEKTSSTIATEAAHKIQSSLGLPHSAMSYMVSHGSLDVGHMQSFEKIVNRLTSSADQQAVEDMALAMYQLYGNIFREIPALAKSSNLASKVA